MEKNSNKDITILIVAADQNFINTTSRILQSEEYEVHTASTGSGCFKLKNDKNPDLILLDLVLPDTDGRDICRGVNSNPKFAHIHIILLSDLRTPSNEPVEATELGADNYLVRPVGDRELAAIVNATGKMIRVENQLRESEENYRLLVEHQNDLVVKFDEHNRLLYVNPNYCRTCGLAEQDILGKVFLPLIHEDDIETVKASIDSLRIPPHTSYHEERAKTVDGWRWLGWSLKGLVDDNGKIKETIAVGRDITERKQTEEKLLNSEERFRKLYENSPFGIIVNQLETDAQGQPIDFIHLQANPSAPVHLGMSLADLVGTKATEIADEETASKFIQKYGEVVRNGIPCEFEYYFNHHDRTLWVTAFHLVDDLFITTFTDITERKEAEEAVRNAHKRLEVAVAGGGLGTWEWIVPTGETVIDDRWQTMLGYEPGEVGQRLECAHELTDPKALPHLHKLMGEHLNGTTSYYEAVYRMRHKNGKWIWIHDRGQVTERSEDGSPYRVCGTHADITPLKQAEHELTQSKQLLDSVINGISEPVFVKDEDHRLIMFNKAYHGMLQSSPEQLLGKTDYDLFSKEEADVFRERDNMVLRQGKHDVNEEEVTLEGSTRIFSTSKSVFTNPITGKQNIVGITRDISDEKVIKRQLHQAQKMESIGRLAGGIAHDYNNMLSIIIGYSENALETISPEDSLFEDLTEILNAGKRSADITKQLLAFARQQTTAPVILDLNECIESMLKMLRRLLGEDLDLAWLPESQVSEIKIDPTQIDQILANLCINSRDAISDTGKVTIETQNIHISDEYVRNHPDSIPGDYVMLAVSDTGSGMSEDTLKQIYEPFFTTKGKFKGTGLGLSTVYGIVKQNLGFINVYSEVGSGTTFKCYFPVYEGSGEKEHPANEHAPLPGNGEVILLVEDDRSILKLGQKMLISMGYDVISVSDPTEAVNIADNTLDRVHLLITDVVMPGMNGRELSERLQQKKPNLKTLYMSGYTANVIAHGGVLKEGVNFVQKPLSKKELSYKVREVLDTVNKRV